MVGEVIVTAVTLAVVALASGELACAWITVANWSPFCSRAILVAAGVAPEKKVCQALVIAAVGEALVEAAGAGLGEVEAAVEVLPQAATITGSARRHAASAARPVHDRVKLLMGPTS